MILFYCDFVKLPPYPTKILKIAMSLRDMQIHVGKLGHISTDSWELFSVLWPATTASTIHSTIHCIIYNKHFVILRTLPYNTRLLQIQIIGGSFPTRPNTWTTLSLHLFSLKSPYTKLCLRYTLRSSRNPLLYILYNLQILPIQTSYLYMPQSRNLSNPFSVCV